MEAIEKSGRSVEEAVQAGLEELALPQDQVKVEVLEEPRSVLGLIGHPARVRLTPMPPLPEQAVQVLGRMLELAGLEASPELVRADEEQVQITLRGTDIGMVIGTHGRTLQALQHLLNLVANRQRHQRRRIILDAEGYRERRESILCAMALRAARRARESGQEVILQPLPAIERRVVHLALQQVPGVETRSMGEEPERRVIVIPSDR